MYKLSQCKTFPTCFACILQKLITPELLDMHECNFFLACEQLCVIKLSFTFT
jgi:hypothetical protein